MTGMLMPGEILEDQSIGKPLSVEENAASLFHEEVI